MYPKLEFKELTPPNLVIFEKLSKKKWVYPFTKSKITLRFALAYGIGPWCNGNTAVFGAVVLGSSPSGPTETFSAEKVFFRFMVFSSLLNS